MHIELLEEPKTPCGPAGDVEAIAEARAHVRAIYRAAWDADVTALPPRLMVARSAGGGIACVAGVRLAEDGFFSQAYLDAPVPEVLGALAGVPVAAAAVLEVVSFAARSPAAVLPVLDAILDWGRGRGLEWGLFTATAPLRRMLARAGLAHAVLAPARPERIGNAAAWGRYYDADPRVCAFRDGGRVPVVLSPRAARAPAAAAAARRAC